MTRIVDVDYLGEFKLHLVFSDGFEGEADLANVFAKPLFNAHADDFTSFTLTEETLCWGNDGYLSPQMLREITEGDFTAEFIDANDPVAILTAAFRESLEEDDPNILKAAVKGYADERGMTSVVNKAGIRSRSSAYKSVDPGHSPKLETIIKMCSAIVSMAK